MLIVELYNFTYNEVYLSDDDSQFTRVSLGKFLVYAQSNSRIRRSDTFKKYRALNMFVDEEILINKM